MLLRALNAMKAVDSFANGFAQSISLTFMEVKRGWYKGNEGENNRNKWRKSHVVEQEWRNRESRAMSCDLCYQNLLLQYKVQQQGTRLPQPLQPLVSGFHLSFQAMLIHFEWQQILPTVSRSRSDVHRCTCIITLPPYYSFFCWIFIIQHVCN